MRPLLVGEDNPHHSDPRLALWPRPSQYAGGRLCRILGMDERRYLRAFDRVNLCDGAWDAAEARANAERLLGLGKPLVLLGSKVCRAFGATFTPETLFTVRELAPGVNAAVLPHPSGRCRAWNDAGSYQRARDAVASLADTAVKEGS